MFKLKNKVIAWSLLVVMLFGLFLGFEDVSTVEAADNYYKVGQTNNIGAYWTQGRKTAPDITELITDGSVSDKDWLFAGWYTSAECTIPWSDTASGIAYAKFIPASTFTTLCQVLATTTEHSTEASKLRILMTVDTLKYAQVGFKIKLNGVEKTTMWSNTVYTNIQVADCANDVSYSKLPSDIDANAKYFSTITIVNIGKENWQKPIYVTPCWETQDGTIVEGMGRYARVEDSYKHIVNIPIRLFEDTKDVAAGRLKVTYNSKFTYEGYDAGTVFEEVTAGDDTANRTVSCVGNVRDISNNKAADGMYMNLRFSVSDLTQLGTTETFDVTANEFCDISENIVTVDVANVTYTNYNK